MKTKRIIDNILKISWSYSPTIVFDDWVKMMTMCFANSTNINKDELYTYRESLYKETAKKYTKEQLKLLCECMGILVELFTNEISDYLGEIYMGCNMGNTRLGQFFTPASFMF